jgi:hypothetical protein
MYHKSGVIKKAAEETVDVHFEGGLQQDGGCSMFRTRTASTRVSFSPNSEGHVTKFVAPKALKVIA